jgi:biotin carboxyl carrier protein
VTGAPDPGAVRVRLAPTSASDEAAVLRVAPVAEPPVLAQRQVLVDDVPSAASLQAVGHNRFVLDVDGARTLVVLGEVHARGGIVRREVLVRGFRFEIEVESERIAALRERATRGKTASAHAGPLEVRAIIPGKVASVSVAVGDVVTAGQQLLVIEAMKMQNELRASRDGTIDRVEVAPGVNIEVGDLLVVMS